LTVKKISSRQFGLLVLLYSLGDSILFLPGTTTSFGHKDAWISIMIGSLAGIVITFIYGKVMLLYPDITFVELTQYALGKLVGTILLLLFLYYYFISSCFLLWDIGDFTVTQILPETPIHSIYILFLIPVLYGVRAGLETIARATEILAPWIFILLILLIAVLFPEYKYENLTPVFENGFIPILQGSYLMIGLPLVQFSIFLLITPSIKKGKSYLMPFIIGSVLGNLCTLLITISCILVLGAESTSRHTFPVYILGKKVTIGEFLQRIEIFIAIIWFLSIYVKLTLTTYGFIYGISNMLKLKNYQPLTFPFGLIMLAGVLIFIPHQVFAFDFFIFTWHTYSFMIAFAIPLLVYLFGYLKKKKLSNKLPTFPSSKNY